MDMEELLSHCQAAAIHGRILPDAAALYRKFCRQYSKKFFTPLPMVEELDAIHVIQSIYEDQLESFSLDDDDHVIVMLQRLLQIEDPNYEVEEEKDIQSFIKDAEDEEEMRLDNNISLLKALKPKTTKQIVAKAEKEAKQELSKQGGINFAYLAESENES